MTPILGNGIYTFREAAQLVGLRPKRIREWFRGRTDKGPVFTGDYDPVDGDLAISFHDLIDVHVAGQLRERGVSLQTLRKVYNRMREDLKTEHPFCRRELLTDGKIVFMQGLDAEGQEELSEVLTRQKVFPEVILPFLEKIDYEQVKLLARRWRIADGVVLDPAICLGKPIVEAVSVPTAILAAAYRANEKDADLVADWYGVRADHVMAAVDFEDSLTRVAA